MTVKLSNLIRYDFSILANLSWLRHDLKYLDNQFEFKAIIK